MPNFQYTPYAIPLAISALISIVLVLYLRARKELTGAKPAMIIMGALFVWSAGYMLELLGADISTKLFWAKIQYIGIVSIPPSYLFFALEFSGHKAWLTRKRMVALLIVPMAALSLAFTNETHRLIWIDWHIKTIDNTLILQLGHGIAFWIYIAYTYILLIASTFSIIQILIHRPQLFQAQCVGILVGVLVPWIGNIVSIFGLLPIPVDLTPFSFTVTGMAITWIIFRYRFMEIVPIAFETVVESMLDSVLMLDNNNRIIDVNPVAQEVLGLSPDQIIGNPVREIIKSTEHIFDQSQTITQARDEIVINNENGQRHFELLISPLKSRQGNTLGRAIVLHDISDRKKAENEIAKTRDEALEANKMKSQYLATISHEIRTPLGIIRGYADLLNVTSETFTPVQKKAVAEIIDGTDRASEMISELLDEARLAAGAVQLEEKSFSPQALFKNVGEKMSVLAEKKGLKIITKIDPELPVSLWGDPTRLQQILLNLANNSIKFTESGEIQIHCYLIDKNFWALEVTDTGHGIPKDAQSTIFEPFRQADETIPRKHGGTGLGLTIVKHLVELMQGKVSVTSEVEKGSTFTVTLPLKQRQQI